MTDDDQAIISDYPEENVFEWPRRRRKAYRATEDHKGAGAEGVPQKEGVRPMNVNPSPQQVRDAVMREDLYSFIRGVLPVVSDERTLSAELAS